MYVLYVVPQLLFAPEWLVTQIARGFNLCVDITIVVIEKGFNWKLLSTKVANKFTNHFRLLLLSDLILRNRKIARKMVARILLMLLIYFGRKYTVCWGPRVGPFSRLTWHFNNLTGVDPFSTGRFGPPAGKTESTAATAPKFRSFYPLESSGLMKKRPATAPFSPKISFHPPTSSCWWGWWYESAISM